jgi:hypothetical protein
MGTVGLSKKSPAAHRTALYHNPWFVQATSSRRGGRLAYDRKTRELFGEFARLSFPEDYAPVSLPGP